MDAILEYRHYIWVFITLNKLLKIADFPNVSFDLIERTVHLWLGEKSHLSDDNVFSLASFLVHEDPIYDFFRKFIKYCQRDASFYYMIYEMLSNQTEENKTFHLVFRSCERLEWFKD